MALRRGDLANRRSDPVADRTGRAQPGRPFTPHFTPSGTCSTLPAGAVISRVSSPWPYRPGMK